MYMHWNNLSGFSPAFADTVFILFLFALIWSLIWKGIALWHAARDGSKVWFVVFLFINTLGILEILYVYLFRKKKHSLGEENNKEV